MGLISIHGANPFDGQADPYLSMDSNISYENGKGEVKNNYTLNGVLTGCSKNNINKFTERIGKFF